MSMWRVGAAYSSSANLQDEVGAVHVRGGVAKEFVLS